MAYTPPRHTSQHWHITKPAASGRKGMVASQARGAAEAGVAILEAGGTAADAFHLVIPSLPGYGFSGKPAETGWGVNRIAAAWEVLMERLGYGDSWLAQGGDWGAAVTTRLGARRHKGLASVHVNMPIVMPKDPTPPFSPEELRMIEQMQYYAAHEAGYSTQQATRPQTLGYALADSAAGQAAWIYEKFSAWNGRALPAKGHHHGRALSSAQDRILADDLFTPCRRRRDDLCRRDRLA
jgi:pimeloyl-ACP methyl ester carboxylesterase